MTGTAHRCTEGSGRFRHRPVADVIPCDAQPREICLPLPNGKIDPRSQQCRLISGDLIRRNPVELHDRSRRQRIVVRSVPELSEIVAAPAGSRPVLVQGTGVCPHFRGSQTDVHRNCIRDASKSSRPGRRRRRAVANLTGVVRSPARNAAAAVQRAGTAVTHGDLHDILDVADSCQPGADRPGQRPAIGVAINGGSTRAIRTDRDGYRRPERFDLRGSVSNTEPPARDAASAVNSATGVRACCNRHDVAQAGDFHGHMAGPAAAVAELPVGIGPPARDSPITVDGAREVRPSADSHGICDSGNRDRKVTAGRVSLPE